MMETAFRYTAHFVLKNKQNIIFYFRRVRKVVTHKQFDKFTYEYDIALLELHGSDIQYQVYSLTSSLMNMILLC